MWKKFKGHWILRVLLPGAIILLMLLMMVPVLAATTTVNMAGTWNVTCNVPVKSFDGARVDTVRTAVLTIASNTVTTRGVVASATIAVPNYGTLAVTGFVGKGTTPYLSLTGSGEDISVVLTGKVHVHGSVPQSVLGSILGFGTHSQGVLGDVLGSAEWSTVASSDGAVSCLLTKAGEEGSTYVEWPAVAITGKYAIHVSDLDTIVSGWGINYLLQLNKHYGPQIELRFTCPMATNYSGVGHVDITLQPGSSPRYGVGSGAWLSPSRSITSATSYAIFYGWDNFDGTMFSEVSGNQLLSATETNINAITVAEHGALASVSDWVLTKVRVELWEAEARTCYVDDVMIGGRLYSFEPVQFSGSFTARP